jgi:hypothetical protein
MQWFPFARSITTMNEHEQRTHNMLSMRILCVAEQKGDVVSLCAMVHEVMDQSGIGYAVIAFYPNEWAGG